MGTMVREDARVARIDEVIVLTSARAEARGDEAAAVTAARLGPLLPAMAATRDGAGAARRALVTATAGRLAAHRAAFIEVGTVFDEMRNSLGRPARHPAIAAVFPGGLGAYTDAPRAARAALLPLLATRLAAPDAPPWAAPVRAAWAARLDAAGAHLAAAEAAPEPKPEPRPKPQPKPQPKPKPQAKPEPQRRPQPKPEPPPAESGAAAGGAGAVCSGHAGRAVSVACGVRTAAVASALRVVGVGAGRLRPLVRSPHHQHRARRAQQEASHGLHGGVVGGAARLQPYHDQIVAAAARDVGDQVRRAVAAQATGHADDVPAVQPRSQRVELPAHKLAGAPRQHQPPRGVGRVHAHVSIRRRRLVDVQYVHRSFHTRTQLDGMTQGRPRRSREVYRHEDVQGCTFPCRGL
jgi:hypothetical protein